MIYRATDDISISLFLAWQILNNLLSCRYIKLYIMRNLFLLLFIPLFFFSCIEVEKEIEVGKELEVVIVEFGDLTSLSDDKQYGNFEIKVPEINDEVMQEGAVLAYIERAATEERPQRWSQFPQYNPVWKEIGDTTFSYLSYGEGFVRISLQSETSVEGIAETYKGLKLKLVIFE